MLSKNQTKYIFTTHTFLQFLNSFKFFTNLNTFRPSSHNSHTDTPSLTFLKSSPSILKFGLPFTFINLLNPLSKYSSISPSVLYQIALIKFLFLISRILNYFFYYFVYQRHCNIIFKYYPFVSFN